MVYFCYSSSLNVCVAYIFFVLDSHLATLWESKCPFLRSASDVSIRV